MINNPSDTFNAVEYAQPKEKYAITRAIIIRCIKSRYRDQRILGCFLVLLLTPIFAALAFIPGLTLACTGMAALFLVIGLYLFIDASVKIKKLMNLDFTVTTDMFCAKNETVDREDHRVTGRNLVFQKYGKYKLVSGRYMLNGMDDLNLFNYAEYGQNWYLVVLNGIKSIPLAFPTDLFCLADGEFVYADGVYTPVKTVRVAELTKSELTAELEQLTPEQSNLIAQAKKAVKDTGTVSLISGCGTALCVILLIAGFLVKPLSGINLILLLVIACATNIPALIAARRSAVACRKVDSDYSEHTELLEAQSGRAFLAAMFLFLNIIICMANAVIYIKSI